MSVFLSVCVCVCVCVCARVCVCVFICLWVGVHVRISVCLCTSERMQSILKNARHPSICSVLEKTVCMKNRIREAEFS